MTKSFFIPIELTIDNCQSKYEESVIDSSFYVFIYDNCQLSTYLCGTLRGLNP
jgi:hypothetical protein